MKLEITIALIVCGTILIAVPPASDFLLQENITKILIQKPEASNVSLGGTMSEEYRFGCWLVGTAMIAVAVISSIVTSRRGAAGGPGRPEQPGSPVDPGRDS